MMKVQLEKRTSQKPIKLASGRNNRGREIGITNQFFYVDDKPWFPVMGEFHFSRYPKTYWKESLLKMRAGGIDTAATYVFWIYHEEIEGEFSWSGNNDLKYFVRLCSELKMNLFLRIGPWVHGEVRNGGFPDWLLEKDFEPRTNNDRYFEYAAKLYKEIYGQVKDYFYKDGGPIIGIQIENEYGHAGGLNGAEGKKHMETLKKLAQKIGFDVPFYTATGWGSSVVAEEEMIPVMAAYADAAWEQSLEPLPLNINYVFRTERDDLNVGTDLASGKELSPSYDCRKFPYLTAELGGGMQVTYHRRPVISSKDTEVMAFVKLGCGANLLGYYMYHGGTNSVGRLSTFQESKETGYPNDLPVLSYDFQAPIGEYGQLRHSYQSLRILHTFSKDFGELLCETDVFIPDETIQPKDRESLRYSIRHKDGAGFIFFNNYQKGLDLTEKEGIQMELSIGEQMMEISDLSLKNGRYLMIPFNLHMEGASLKYSTSQLLCKLEDNGEYYYFFFTYSDLKTKYVFSSDSVKVIKGNASIKKDNICLNGIKPGLDSIISVMDNDQKVIHIITVTREDAEKMQKIKVWGKERVFFSNGNIIVNENNLEITNRDLENFDFTIFPDERTLLDGDRVLNKSDRGIFKRYLIQKKNMKQSVMIKNLEEGKWRVKFPNIMIEDVNDIFLRIDYRGNTARIFSGEKLIADNFYNGTTWEIGLKRFKDNLLDDDWTLEIQPFTKEAPVYMDRPPKLVNGKAVSLDNIKCIIEYKAVITRLN